MIRELLNKPAIELTPDEFKTVLEFKRSMYTKLLEVVEGSTILEKDKEIEKLSFDERVELVLGDKDA